VGKGSRFSFSCEFDIPDGQSERISFARSGVFVHLLVVDPVLSIQYQRLLGSLKIKYKVYDEIADYFDAVGMIAMGDRKNNLLIVDSSSLSNDTLLSESLYQLESGFHFLWVCYAQMLEHYKRELSKHDCTFV